MSTTTRSATDSDKLIDEYLALVLEANKKINLTGINSMQEARILHIEDSLTALQEMESAPTGTYGDLGTGAGFPGVPLAIKTGRETLLIDSSQKKMKVVDSFLSQLDLSSQIMSYAGRIETLAKEKPESFAVLTARALTGLPSLLELASPLLQHEGMLICYKAHVDKDEQNDASELETLLGMHLISRRNFVLSDGATYREILVFQKIAPADIELPRRTGLAQKKPLSSKKCFT